MCASGRKRRRTKAVFDGLRSGRKGALVGWKAGVACEVISGMMRQPSSRGREPRRRGNAVTCEPATSAAVAGGGGGIPRNGRSRDRGRSCAAAARHSLVSPSSLQTCTTRSRLLSEFPRVVAVPMGDARASMGDDRDLVATKMTAKFPDIASATPARKTWGAAT